MSMTTELAQRMKAAALKAIADEGPTWWSEEQLASDYGLALHRTDAKFIALASHQNVLALVEALEIAEQNSEGVAGMAEHYETTISMLRSRIAELEARTVKLPEVRITIAESKLRNLTYQQLDAFNAGASRAVAKLSQVLAAAGVAVEGE